MAYDDSSYNGNILCSNFDSKNNIINPPSEMGWFFYVLYGHMWDEVDQLISQMLLDFTPLYCSEEILNLFAKQCRIQRDEKWTNEEFRAVVCLNYYETIILAGMEYVFNNLRVVGVAPETGNIIIEKSYKGFRASNKNITNELTSNQFILNHTMETSSKKDLLIYVPNGINISLVEFMCDYLPFNFEMIIYDN